MNSDPSVFRLRFVEGISTLRDFYPPTPMSRKTISSFFILVLSCQTTFIHELGNAYKLITRVSWCLDFISDARSCTSNVSGETSNKALSKVQGTTVFDRGVKPVHPQLLAFSVAVATFSTALRIKILFSESCIAVCKFFAPTKIIIPKNFLLTNKIFRT